MRPRPYCRPALLPKPNQKSETMVEVCVTRPCFQVSSRNILEIQHAQWLGSRYGLSCFHGGQFLGYSNACPTKYWVWRMKVSLPHGLGARSLSFALMCSRRHMLSHITKSKASVAPWIWKPQSRQLLAQPPWDLQGSARTTGRPTPANEPAEKHSLKDSQGSSRTTARHADNGGHGAPLQIPVRLC